MQIVKKKRTPGSEEKDSEIKDPKDRVADEGADVSKGGVETERVDKEEIENVNKDIIDAEVKTEQSSND